LQIFFGWTIVGIKVRRPYSKALAHGKFKEHSSTHGQQFWVIDALGKTRADGTACEAVLCRTSPGDTVLLLFPDILVEFGTILKSAWTICGKECYKCA
jgi:hypothetical protein